MQTQKKVNVDNSKLLAIYSPEATSSIYRNHPDSETKYQHHEFL